LKRVLIIAYYWPPAGGPGVQRWLQFVNHLPSFGIQPIVYVPDNPSYPIIDESLLSQVPEVEILKQPISEPYKLAQFFSKKDTASISSGLIPKERKQSLVQKFLLFIRGNFFIPDARKSWVNPSVNYLKEYLSNTAVNAIITTGPPHSLHLIGKELKEHLGITWISDFRDPWTSIGYHKKLKLTSWARKKHLMLESSVLNKADHILTTSFTTKKEFEALTKKPISVITNGYNVSDFNLEAEVTLDTKFTIAHIGSLLSDRNPTALWQALQELIKEYKDFAEAFQLKLAGKVSEDLLVVLESFGLKHYSSLLGYISHQDAFKEMQSSQLLLLIEINAEETQGIIAGKIFEYLLAKRPILAIGPNNWDVSKIINDTASGKVYGYEDKNLLKDYIYNAFQEFKLGKLQIDSTHIEQYSRERLTKQLSEVILNTIT
jgi:hypothetical protein